MPEGHFHGKGSLRWHERERVGNERGKHVRDATSVTKETHTLETHTQGPGGLGIPMSNTKFLFAVLLAVAVIYDLL